MRLISKKALTSYSIKHSFFTLIVFLVTVLGHCKENFYMNISCIHGTFPLVLEKTVHLWTSEKNISSSVQSVKKFFFKAQETHTLQTTGWFFQLKIRNFVFSLYRTRPQDKLCIIPRSTVSKDITNKKVTLWHWSTLFGHDSCTSKQHNSWEKFKADW